MPSRNREFLTRALRLTCPHRLSLGAICLGFALMPGAAIANDGVAEVGAGGLEFTSNAFVEMAEEDLRISLDRIDVRYVFKNTQDEPQTLLVAFPLPPLSGEWFGEDADTRLASADPLKYLDFTTKVDGKLVATQNEQRARVLTLDVTEALKAAGLPLFPGAPDLQAKLAKLSGEQLEALIVRGAIERIGTDRFPRWQYSATYYWKQTFIAGKPVVIEHSYRPIAGGSVPYDKFLDDFAGTYCIDDSFRGAYNTTKGKEGSPGFTWVNYILTTAGTWAGPIGKFKLTIEKPSPDSVVSFCRMDVKKTGPTTFEWTAENYSPQDDLDILFLKN